MLWGQITLSYLLSTHTHTKYPKEQFFHTDYHPLMQDRNHYVVDETTQLPPHLLPPPYLVDIDGNAHLARHQEAILKLFRPVEQARQDRSSDEAEDYDEYMKKHLSQIKRHTFRQVRGATNSQEPRSRGMNLRLSTQNQATESLTTTSHSSGSLIEPSNQATSTFTAPSNSGPVIEPNVSSGIRRSTIENGVAGVSMPSSEVLIGATQIHDTCGREERVNQVTSTDTKRVVSKEHKTSSDISEQRSHVTSSENRELTTPKRESSITVKTDKKETNGVDDIPFEIPRGGIIDSDQPLLTTLTSIGHLSSQLEDGTCTDQDNQGDGDKGSKTCTDLSSPEQQIGQYEPHTATSISTSGVGISTDNDSESLINQTQSTTSSEVQVMETKAEERTTACQVDSSVSDPYQSEQTDSLNSKQNATGIDTSIAAFSSSCSAHPYRECLNQSLMIPESSSTSESSSTLDKNKDEISDTFFHDTGTREQSNPVQVNFNLANVTNRNQPLDDDITNRDQPLDDDITNRDLPLDDDITNRDLPLDDVQREQSDYIAIQEPAGCEGGPVDVVGGGPVEVVEVVGGGPVEVVDVVGGRLEGENIQNMLSSLIYTLGLNEMETKQAISLWQNRTIIRPLDSAHIGADHARRRQLYEEEEALYLLQVRRGRENAPSRVSVVFVLYD